MKRNQYKVELTNFGSGGKKLDARSFSEALTLARKHVSAQVVRVTDGKVVAIVEGLDHHGAGAKPSYLKHYTVVPTRDADESEWEACARRAFGRYVGKTAIEDDEAHELCKLDGRTRCTDCDKCELAARSPELMSRLAP